MSQTGHLLNQTLGGRRIVYVKVHLNLTALAWLEFVTGCFILQCLIFYAVNLSESNNLISHGAARSCFSAWVFSVCTVFVCFSWFLFSKHNQFHQGCSCWTFSRTPQNLLPDFKYSHVLRNTLVDGPAVLIKCFRMRRRLAL